MASIRTRLLVAYIGVIVLGFSGLLALAGGQINSAVRADYEQRLQNEIRLIAQALTPTVVLHAKGQVSDDQLKTAFETYETQVSGDLRLYQPDNGANPAPNGGTSTAGPAPGQPGTGPVGVSGTPVAAGGNGEGGGDGDNYPAPTRNGRSPRDGFFNMPEMETAIRGETVVVEREDESGQNVLYTAAAIMADQRIVGLIQLAVPAVALQSIADQRWAALRLGFLLLTSLAVLATIGLSRSIIRPLITLRDSALRFSRGELSYRVPSPGNDEIGAVAHAFNDMAEQVQSMLEEQRAFASNTSHELRTPLTALQLRTEALRLDPSLDSATARRYIEEIDDEIGILTNLVQDLTILSRFDAGRADLGTAEIDIARLASNLCRQLTPIAESRHIALTLSGPDSEEPAMISASISHATVVFRNLLDNAIKYTPAGGHVTWHIQVEPNAIVHRISDDGRGISAEALPHVFERFYRADKAHTRDIPGSGLGLSLVRSVAEAYGAQVTIESEGLGKGTIAHVRWPRAAVPDGEA